VRIALKNFDVYWAPALDLSEAKGKPFSRNIETANENIKTFEALMHITISNEHTISGSKLKFVRIIEV
jgi:hypothetical protein